MEKDILVRQPLAQYLRGCGYCVLEAADDADACETLSRGRHRIDVALISAKSVPSESGFALASWMRRNHPTVKVLLGGTVARVLQLAGNLCDDGPDGPLDHRAVLDRIRRLLATRERGSSDEGSKQ